MVVRAQHVQGLVIARGDDGLLQGDQVRGQLDELASQPVATYRPVLPRPPRVEGDQAHSAHGTASHWARVDTPDLTA